MPKYTIEFSKSHPRESSFIAIPIVEPIVSNENYGDEIGIYQEGNVLEFCEDIDTDDEDIRDFLKQHFKDYKSVLGFMRRILGH
ncbi:MAG: hypothetical protein RBR50_01035 [Candidatus Izemoplasmatales bacterium]|nr:hypothetical protein [Candidatus Izemoplasmatales bacterium]